MKPVYKLSFGALGAVAITLVARHLNGGGDLSPERYVVLLVACGVWGWLVGRSAV